MSFDVVSLYTNVSVNEAIDVCADLLFSKTVIENMDKDTFKILAKLASCNVLISTHDGYFKQIDGLAMGSAPAPHLANGWLSSFDKVIKGSSTLYYRYMDDIITIENKNNIDDKLKQINSLHSFLKFTVEKENDGHLPFLDMLLHNVNGNISSSWFRKSTDTGLTLNFHSLAPLKYKKSVVIGFVHRIYRSCSSWQFIHSGLEAAKEILIKNQYPVHFIEDIFHKTLHKIIDVSSDFTSSEISSDQSFDDNACLHTISDKDKFLFFLNFRGKPTEHFVKSLKKLNAPCRFIMTLVKTKAEISKLKTPVPHMLQNNVVYKITCPGCDASYVGCTTRLLQQRFREHVGSRGLIKNHFDSCQIMPSHDHVKILGKNKGEKLLSLEALFINRFKPTLNSKDEYRSRTLTLKF